MQTGLVTKGDKFCDFFGLPLATNPLKMMGFTLKRKNLLQEQILLRKEAN